MIELAMHFYYFSACTLINLCKSTENIEADLQTGTGYIRSKDLDRLEMDLESRSQST